MLAFLLIVILLGQTILNATRKSLTWISGCCFDVLSVKIGLLVAHGEADFFLSRAGGFLQIKEIGLNPIHGNNDEMGLGLSSTRHQFFSVSNAWRSEHWFDMFLRTLWNLELTRFHFTTHNGCFFLSQFRHFSFRFAAHDSL